MSIPAPLASRATALSLTFAALFSPLQRVAADPATATSAHVKSQFAVIDPAYDALALKPVPDLKNGAPWLYGEAELECWRLHVLRQQTEAAKLKIGYPGSYHEPSPKAIFQLSIEPGQSLPETVDLHAVGDVVVSLGGKELYRGANSAAPHRVTLPRGAATGSLQVALTTRGEPPALLITDGPLATGKAAWRWTLDGTRMETPQSFPQTRSGTPPHQLEPSEVPLLPTGRQGDTYDMGRVLLGRVTFTSKERPQLFVGESEAEAANSDPRHFEQSTALKDNGDGTWTTENALALRYFRLTGGAVTNVKCLVVASPARYRGAFACSDEKLTRVWMTSAYTLRLCRHDFLIDGVKRDRLPWVGDLAMSLMANAYAFGDGEIVRHSLVALGRDGIGKSHLNGIVDYSMWWIIAQDLYQRYYSDPDHLRREWPRIQDTLGKLAARANADGLYQTAPKDWLFVDWVNVDKQTTLQILWWWAQKSAVNLATRVGDKAAATDWEQRAAILAKTLQARAWDSTAGSWRGSPDGKSGPSRHANIVAVISGLADAAQYPAIRASLQDEKIKPVGTPYVGGLENMALARLGAPDTFLARVNSCWGGMLDRGATTFWEAWDPNQRGNDAYSFYKRPFAKSLCHAWSAGPAAFLPEGLLGLRPLEDGWKKFSVDPHLGSLVWACATVPTPHGDIEISVDATRIALRVPKDTTAVVRGKAIAGPRTVTLAP